MTNGAFPVYRVFRIKAGDLEVDLNDEPFALLSGGYAPGFPARGSQISGKGIYSDVQESIAIDIYSTTTAAVLNEGAQRIAKLLDMVDAWARRDSDVPVVLELQPQHSELTDPVAALIVGNDGNPTIQLPATYNDLMTTLNIQGVVLNYYRRGLWLGETREVEQTTTQTVPEIITVDGLGETDILSPTKVRLTDFIPGNQSFGDGFILMTGEPINSVNGKNMALFDAADMTGTNFSSTDDSANEAYGDDIMQINAATNQTGNVKMTLESDFEALAVYLTCRNDSTTTTWRIRARSEGFVTAHTKWIVVDCSTQNPRPISLGVLRSAAKYHSDLYIEAETDGSTGTFSINVVATLPLSTQSHAIGVRGGAYTTSSFTHDLVIDPRALTHRRAIANLRVSD